MDNITKVPETVTKVMETPLGTFQVEKQHPVERMNNLKKAVNDILDEIQNVMANLKEDEIVHAIKVNVNTSPCTFSLGDPSLCLL